MPNDAVSPRRSILLSARLQLSPQTLEPRRAAIDKAVATSLLAADEGVLLTPGQIEETGLLCLRDGRPFITRAELEDSLERLHDEGTLATVEMGSKTAYRLSSPEREKLEDQVGRTERILESVVERVFETAEPSASAYKAPFRDALDVLIGRLSEANILRMIGEAEDAPPLHPEDLIDVVGDLSDEYDHIDVDYMERRLSYFFGTEDPEFNELKWRYAQNTFIIQSLGLDEAGFSLSHELFSDTTFYVDTNVLIHALEPLARHYTGFHAVREARDEFGLDLKAAFISVDETQGVSARKVDTIRKIENQVPPDIQDRVGSLYYRVYKENVLQGDRTIDEAYSDLLNPERPLEEFGVELVEAEWFEKERSTEATNQLVRMMKRKSGKTTNQAVHDALLVRWVHKERRESDDDVWILTTDTELPKYEADDDEGPLAVTLDGFIQWMGTARGQEDETTRNLLSSELRRLLERTGRVFEIEDFLMFARMGMECRELPADDVEECIRTLKNEGFTMNPHNPGEREELISRISRFFASPDRRIQQEVQQLESKVQHATRERDEAKEEVAELEERLEDKSDEVEEADRDRRREERRAEGYRRLSHAVLVGLIALFVFVQFVLPDLSGSNLVQRLGSALPWLGGGLALWVAGAVWWIGQENLETMGLPWSWLAEYSPF